MNENAFQEYAVLSCKQYLNFLDLDNNAGKSFVSVLRFSPSPVGTGHFDLTLSQPLNFVESCYLQIRWEFQNIKEDDITIAKYDRKAAPKLLTVRVKASLVSRFSALSPDDIKIVSDLRFLIERLHKFYSDHCFPLFPSAPSLPPPVAFPFPLSKEQSDAVHCALTHPVSYIWGPPGTGKTRYVLSSCILHYVLNGKRVLLLAPTNNAVEQMLFGLIPVLENSGLPRKKVYRVGIASAKFAETYPDLVSDSATAEMYDEAKKAISVLNSELAARQSYDSKVEHTKKQITAVEAEYSRLEIGLENYNKANQLLISAKELLTAWIKKHSDNASALENAKSSFSLAKAILSEYEQEVDSLSSRILVLRFLPWKRKERHLLSDRLLSAHNKLEAQAEAVISLRANVEAARKAFNASELSVASARKDYSIKKQRRDAILNQLISSCRYPSFCDILRTLFDLDDESIEKEFFACCFRPSPNVHCMGTEQIYEKLSNCRDNEIKKLSAMISDCKARTTEEIKQDITVQEKRLSELDDSRDLKRRKEALVLSGTVDSLLKMLSTDERETFSHVFLDEAGYTSILRGMVSFCCGCPVTFLGDHFQLPPIFAKKHISEKESSLCLFALPISYYADLYTGSLETLFHIYQSINSTNLLPVPPNCSSPSIMAYSPLSHSFRFSDSLASLLGQYIYRTDFSGIKGKHFEIIVINAPDRDPKARYSKSEASAILSYVRQFLSPNDDFVILAPYNAQVKLIQSTLGKNYDNIMTVHRSQGQEYDTVILSVTDTKRKFLVGTDCPQGRSVLNTAISRARNRLVIVCDVSFWRRQKNQLITELISLGTLVSPSAPTPAELTGSTDHHPARKT